MRHTDDAVGSSKALENQKPMEKGKEKVQAFKLALDIEHRSDLRKVFKKQILDSTVEFSLCSFSESRKRSSMIFSWIL